MAPTDNGPNVLHHVPMTTRPVLRTAFFLCVFVFATSACNASITFGSGESGSGDLVTESYQLDGFDTISIEDAFDVVIEVGQDYSLEVTVDDNFVDELDIRVRGDELKVGLDDGASVGNGTFEATVRLPELVALSASGATEVVVEGVSTDELDLEVSGASDLFIEGQAKSIILDASGSSDVEIDLDGVGEVEVDLSGATSASFASAGTISGEVSGASDLRVPESTSIRVETSGASTISADG